MKKISPAVSSRLHFIDALRAFAILMMLQGHFIDVSLDSAYRDSSYTLYAWWAWMRGLTAPIFFTVTGLVFCYLLSGKTTESIFSHNRWKKGIRRGLMLIAIGYILRFNLVSLANLEIAHWSYQTDVLHCIGISLLFICLIYAIVQQSHRLMMLLLLASGLVIFLTEPIYSTLNVDHLAYPIRHYINKQHGAIFSPLPWLGYSCFGGVIGLLLRRLSKKSINLQLPISLVAIGLCLQFLSSYLLMILYFKSDWEVFRSIAYNNNSFFRFGQSAMAIGIFILLFRSVKRLPDWIQKTGSETLSIYTAHYVVLYGTWFNFGLKTFFANALSPIQAAIGAAVFVCSGILLAVNIEEWRQQLGYYRFTNLPKRIVSAWR